MDPLTQAFLLKQIPLVVFSWVVIAFVYRMLLTEKKERKADAKAYKKELQKKDETHSEELKELNAYIRDRDLENMEILTKIETHLTSK